MSASIGLCLVAGLALIPDTARTREPAPGSEVAGTAHIVDGDTIIVGGQRIRLEGIDAPESRQFCGPRGRRWPAGKIATRALARLIGGRRVHCTETGRDRYGRMLGHCRAGTADLNAAMVRQGMAWAFRKYSQTFIGEERTAKWANVGLWRHSCEPAWAFRARRWHAGGQKAPSGCAIKGNISRNGRRLYHTPWSRWYDKTRIDEARGERWFCNERQALAAGWKAAR